MRYLLRDVWCAPYLNLEFTNQQDFDLAKQLAAMSPYNVRWDGAWFATYTRLYGQGAADILNKTREEGRGNGLLVVSNQRELSVDGSIFIQSDPVPELAPGPDEEFVQLSGFGRVIRTKAVVVRTYTEDEIKALATDVCRQILTALGIIRT